MSKLVCGFGKNDIKGSSKEKYYKVWVKMLIRCYNEKHLISFPTYKDVYVCEEWHTLSNFREWFDIHYINGYVLDKDLYIPNNKVYSPEACLFIPDNINSLIIRQYEKGYHISPYGKYIVQIRIMGKKIYLGIFDTEEKAHQIYIEYKAEWYIETADNWINENPKIWIGLYRHADMLLHGNYDSIN